MAFHRLVGLKLRDADGYAQYREAMKPLLEAAGGRFRYDFEVSKTLKSEQGQEINRVFLLAFPEKAASDAFFADPEYLKVRERYFAPSVAEVSILAEFSS
jgi:uncharacterized protein (DUF1330 family)